MTVHIVSRDENFTVIGRRYSYRHWQNIYFAEENNDLRDLRPNPDRIFPGDTVVIPHKGQVIAALESRPERLYTDVPLFTQPSVETCWRACGKMLFMWRHRGAGAEADFERRIGATYRNMEVGLPDTRWQDFYASRLGMMGTGVDYENLLHYILAVRGPAIVAMYTDDPGSAHAMVMAGYNLFRRQWFILNPAPRERMDFEAAEITVDRRSGRSAVSGGGDLTGFSTGPATAASMGRWFDISGTALRREVYHY